MASATDPPAKGTRAQQDRVGGGFLPLALVTTVAPQSARCRILCEVAPSRCSRPVCCRRARCERRRVWCRQGSLLSVPRGASGCRRCGRATRGLPFARWRLWTAALSAVEQCCGLLVHLCDCLACRRLQKYASSSSRADHKTQLSEAKTNNCKTRRRRVQRTLRHVSTFTARSTKACACVT